MNKQYISVGVGNMYLYLFIGCYDPDCRCDNKVLSNGDNMKLFFEYNPPRKTGGGTPSHVKEIITKRTYNVNRGFRSTPGSIEDPKYGTVAYEGEGYSKFFMEHMDKEEVMDYFNKLKSDGVYKEYASNVQKFYDGAKEHLKYARQEAKSTLDQLMHGPLPKSK